MIKTIEDLKRICDFNNGRKFIIVYEDRMSEKPISIDVHEHPINAIRNLPKFLETFHIGLKDVAVLLIGYIGEKYELIESGDIYELDPKMYFTELDKEPAETK